MRKIIVGSPHEKEHKTIAQEIFGGYLGDSFEDFVANLNDNQKEILLRSAHFLKFYVHELNELPKEKGHLRDIYGFIGLTSLVEFCALSDPKFKRKSEEEAFKNYLKKGLTSQELSDLVKKIKIFKEDLNLPRKKRIEGRLKLLYEFRSSFVHYLKLPPVKRQGILFFAHFHQTGLAYSLIAKKDRFKNQEGLYLTIKLSLTDYMNLIKYCILRNLGYDKASSPSSVSSLW